MQPTGGEIKPPWDGRGVGGSIVFYKEQETSLKEYMKETLKQMQISKGGPLRSSPSCSARGQPAEAVAVAGEGWVGGGCLLAGDTRGPLGCRDLVFPPE